MLAAILKKEKFFKKIIGRSFWKTVAEPLISTTWTTKVLPPFFKKTVLYVFQDGRHHHSNINIKSTELYLCTIMVWNSIILGNLSIEINIDLDCTGPLMCVMQGWRSVPNIGWDINIEIFQEYLLGGTSIWMPLPQSKYWGGPFGGPKILGGTCLMGPPQDRHPWPWPWFSSVLSFPLPSISTLSSPCFSSLSLLSLLWLFPLISRMMKWHSLCYRDTS